MSAATILDVEYVWPGSVIHDEERDCAACGDEFEPEDDGVNDGAIAVVWEPSDQHRGAIDPVHPACAVRNGFRLRWPPDDREVGPAASGLCPMGCGRDSDTEYGGPCEECWAAMPQPAADPESGGGS